MSVEIRLDSTGTPVFDEFGDLAMTSGPETSIFLAIDTRLDSIFRLANVGSGVRAFLSGPPPATVDIETAARVALQELEAQGVLTLRDVRLVDDVIIVTVAEVAAPLTLEMP